jgi:hypothetical protein
MLLTSNVTTFTYLIMILAHIFETNLLTLFYPLVAVKDIIPTNSILSRNPSLSTNINKLTKLQQMFVPS